MDSPLRAYLRRYALYNRIKDLVFRLPMLRAKPMLENVTWGTDFPDKHFLLIRRGEYGVGLFSLFMTNLAWIRYAHEHGLIAIVDMQTERNIYQKKILWKRENAWETFFEQPFGYYIDDIRHAKHITIARAFRDEEGFLPSQWMDPNSLRNVFIWRDIVKRYIKVKEGPLSRYYNKELEDELKVGHSVLGVLARGTDYVTLKPVGHPVQPVFEDFKHEIESFRETGSEFDKIYLVTEDKCVAKQFVDRYKSQVILSKQPTVKYSGGYLASNRKIKNCPERGIGYLKAIVDLARCDYLIAGRTSGAVGALLLSQGFKRVSFFDLGSY